MLNLDILFVVESYCDEKTLEALIRTCKPLSDVAARRLVELEDAVYIEDDHDLDLFLRFIGAGKGRRWTSLRGLSFEGQTYRADLAKILASELRKAINLTRLIFDDAEATLSSHHALPVAIASLPKVTCLSTHKAGLHTRTMLEAMHWPLEEASMSLPLQDYRSRRADITDPYLRNACNTLRSLALSGWPGGLTICKDHPVFAQLTTLSISSVHLPPTAPWARTFPNLVNLRLRIGPDANYPFPVLGPADFARYRGEREANREAHLSQGTWLRLGSLCEGKLLSLYRAGIPCEIRDVDMDVPGSQLCLLAETMADARPTELTLSLSGLDCLDNDGQWVLDCLRPSTMINLRRLDLQVVALIKPGRQDLEAIFVSPAFFSSLLSFNAAFC